MALGHGEGMAARMARRVLSMADVTPEHWAEIAKSDPVVDWMLHHKASLTREEYLSLAYLGAVPEGDDWDAELEAGLPWPFRLDAFEDQEYVADRLGIELD